MDHIDRLVTAGSAQLAAKQRPSSTYRVQFHAGFTFSDATSITDYLRDLGVTDVYASPYLKARKGSTHGYDVVDHHVLNPELGSRADYENWVAALKRHGLSHILDIVPNHMGVATNDNPWWNDVLMHGRASRSAPYFDITWSTPARPDLKDKVLLPILGESFGSALEKGQLSLAIENEALVLCYFDRRLPLNPRTTVPFFQAVAKLLQQQERQNETGGTGEAERPRLSGTIHLAALYEKNPQVTKAIQDVLASYNGRIGLPRSFDMLDALIAQQHYRLAYWRTAAEKINYRRFFDINDFAAIRMESEEAFQESHRLVFELIGEGKIAGLRIDHPDGLFDPGEYLRRLQIEALVVHAKRAHETDATYAGIAWEEAEPEIRRRLLQRVTAKTPPTATLPVVVEKILAADETLPVDWLVDGTSGYDFLNKVSGLFVDPEGREGMTAIYQSFTGEKDSYMEVVDDAKRLVLEHAFAAELEQLATQAYELAQRTRAFRDISFAALRGHLRELIVAFPVYRSYVIDGGASADDRRVVEEAIARALARHPGLDAAMLGFLKSMILLETPTSFSSEDIVRQRGFAGKFQQLTAPVTAKGVEDTAFYRYHRLVSLNEVGGDPDVFGISSEALHAYFAERQAKWPYSLSTLATHDTKRGEDVRARLHVLSEVPTAWEERVRRWWELNVPYRRTVKGTPLPSSNDEYLFYQTLVGTWPFGAQQADADYANRLSAYMLKAVKEAKVHTSWTDPVESYERAVSEFVRGSLASAAFVGDLLPFVAHISRIGMLTSLSQTVLRLTAPGIPDTYQGGEWWDLSLVDPDNRRLVDYAARRAMLAALHKQFDDVAERPGLMRSMMTTPEDGRLKMHVLTRGLRLRRAMGDVFARGDYLPVQATGLHARHLFSFVRKLRDRWILVVVPRLIAAFMGGGTGLLSSTAGWEDTMLKLPEGLATDRSLQHLFSGGTVKLNGASSVPVARLFEEFPVAVLTSHIS